MHDTALVIADRFFQTYRDELKSVAEVGSYNVNGSLRIVAPIPASYCGMDTEAGPGVDVVVRAGERLPFDDSTFDAVVTSSVFEHDPAFWSTFLELVRIVKDDGLIYMNAPSNGEFHRYPQDCWRFYPDSGRALEQWAKRNGITITLVESFVLDRYADCYNDFVAIFRKSNLLDIAGCRFISDDVPCRNVIRHGEDNILNFAPLSQDMDLAAGRASTYQGEITNSPYDWKGPSADRSTDEAIGRLIIFGRIDECLDGIIHGWILDRTAPWQHIEVELYMDGQFIGCTLANVYRSDLEEFRIGRGDHAFRLRVPKAFRDGTSHAAELRVGGADRPVHCTELHVAEVEL